MSEVLLSQLAYAELISPKPDETVAVAGRRPRAGGDDPRGPVRLPARLGRVAALEPDRHRRARAGARPHRVAHVRPRATRRSSPSASRASGSASARVAARPTPTGLPVGQHLHEVFWEAERYEAPPEKAEPDQLFRPQKFPGRGAQARYIDHVTIATPSIAGRHRVLQDARPRHTAQITRSPASTSSRR